MINRIKGNKSLFGSTTSSTPTASSSATGRFVFMDFCHPAKIYLILAVLSMIYYVSTDQGITWLIIKALVFILWAFLLNKLCTSGNKAIAWLLAIIPQTILLICTVKPSKATLQSPAAMTMMP